MTSITALRNFATSMRDAGKSLAHSQAAKTTSEKLAKWGVPVGAIAAGSYLIPTAAGAGIDNAVGVNVEKPNEGISKILSWGVFLLIAGVVICVFLPKMKELLK